MMLYNGHYKLNKPAVIETDASIKGLGGVLIQDNKYIDRIHSIRFDISTLQQHAYFSLKI